MVHVPGRIEDIKATYIHEWEAKKVAGEPSIGWGHHTEIVRVEPFGSLAVFLKGGKSTSKKTKINNFNITITDVSTQES